jgi:hypothetical protein
MKLVPYKMGAWIAQPFRYSLSVDEKIKLCAMISWEKYYASIIV